MVGDEKDNGAKRRVMNRNTDMIGFVCAYTPLPLIHAAGFAPYRILPNVDCPDQAGRLMHDNLCPHIKRVLSGAIKAGARGVIGYTAKFCDPYIARLPGVRDALKREGIPFLLLEGDCTLRSIGQHRTRIEAFMETERQRTPLAVTKAVTKKGQPCISDQGM
jgi:benzoyl-CoA reductase/2-hydroxyglutaryl-CoA dehydratase subunit BcrC/BadD/HgdB